MAFFTQLLSRNVIAVVAAGSPGEYTFPSDCPNAPLIVASSSDNHGLAAFAKMGANYVYAPGSIPPNPTSTPTSCPKDNCVGADVSAGQVSGLVVYFLSLSARIGNTLPLYDTFAGNGPRWSRMLGLLQYWSYPRQPGAVKEIWNGFGFKVPISGNPPMKARDGTDTEILSSTTSTSTFSTIPSHRAPNSTSTSSVYPAWPTGFHIIGYSSPGSKGDASLGVVGSANDNCRTIINNQVKYGAYGFLGDGTSMKFMYPNYYVNSSTTQFYLLPKSDPGLCGVSSPKNFRLSFFGTWATNGPGSFGKETSYLMLFCPDAGANRVK